MRVKITQTGVYVKDEDGADTRVPVGEVIEIEGDTIPAGLVNKCEPVDSGDAKEKSAVTSEKGGGKRAKAE